MCKTMSGYFRRAPLSYVSIKLDTTGLPPLFEHQYVKLFQAMVGCNLVMEEASSGKEIQFGPDAKSGVSVKDVPRRCFMNATKTNAFLLDRDCIEWRTTKYNKYSKFIDDFNDVFNAFITSIPEITNVLIREAVLSYVDVVVPEGDHLLSDYFVSTVVLPLNNVADKGIMAIGRCDYSKVVEPTLKIDVSLEQLPQKIQKFLPEVLMEPENKFAMPIKIDFKFSPESTQDYALLMTRASSLIDKKLSDFDSVDAFLPLHKLTRSEFNSIINLPFCKKMWDYVEEVK